MLTKVNTIASCTILSTSWQVCKTELTPPRGDFKEENYMKCDHDDMSWNSKESFFFMQTKLSINYVSRKKLNINGKLNVYQQFTPSVTMLTTKCNPERFTIVTKQDDELLHRECSLTLEGWLKTNGIGLIDTEPLLYHLRVLQLQDQMPTQGNVSANTATFDYRLCFNSRCIFM